MKNLLLPELCAKCKASTRRKRKVEKEGSKGSGRKPNYAK